LKLPCKALYICTEEHSVGILWFINMGTRPCKCWAHLAIWFTYQADRQLRCCLSCCSQSCWPSITWRCLFVLSKSLHCQDAGKEKTGEHHILLLQL